MWKQYVCEHNTRQHVNDASNVAPAPLTGQILVLSVHVYTVQCQGNIVQQNCLIKNDKWWIWIRDQLTNLLVMAKTPRPH